jgi:hypothetical protein
MKNYEIHKLIICIENKEELPPQQEWIIARITFHNVMSYALLSTNINIKKFRYI